jgi:hypothetical protein
MKSVVDTLLASEEPSIRWKVRTGVLGEDRDARPIQALEREIRGSPRVRALLAHHGKRRLAGGRNAYDKWQGAHWVLATLADLGYPRQDEALEPLRDQVLDMWLHDDFYVEFEVATKAASYSRSGVPRIQGRHRRCASQQGNALLFLTRLGLADERTEKLVERLLHWRWPDGGWNCDRNPSADSSSFMETRHAMLGLFAHAERTGDKRAREAALGAAEVFLERRIFKRLSDGKVMDKEFVLLHYPLYWHYDVLAGLVALTAIGRVRDPRCADALDWLESRRLPDGGWPAEKRYYKVSADRVVLNADFVDWGGTSKKKRNDWVTADALAVLRAAGRV